MPTKAAPLEGLHIWMSELGLSGATFTRTDGGPVPADGAGALAASFELRLIRFAPAAVGVELTGRLELATICAASATYRARFDLASQADRPIGDDVLKAFVAGPGPGALYPFVRETLMGLFQKAGLPITSAPLVNFATVFSADAIDLPPMPGPQPSP